MTRVADTRVDAVRLDDPAALRALAHPARLAVVDVLYQGGERTSSELAELTRLSPSAMSYHLRTLARAGIVERAPRREDGRERPWRAAGRSLSLRGGDRPTDVATKDALATVALQHLRDELRRWAATARSETATWREVARLQRSYLWLTEPEAAALTAELDALLERYEAGRDSESHPPDARRVFSLHAVVPESDAGL
jgi:DNA-binding transcriptional ArsR family regulator